MNKNFDNIFENIKHIDKNKTRFWYARELMPLLGYKKWYNFLNVIDKAKENCKSMDINAEDHFIEIGNMVQIGYGATRSRRNLKLTHNACYLIAQNADSRKDGVMIARTYFAKNLLPKGKKLNKKNTQKIYDEKLEIGEIIEKLPKRGDETFLMTEQLETNKETRVSRRKKWLGFI